MTQIERKVLPGADGARPERAAARRMFGRIRSDFSGAGLADRRRMLRTMLAQSKWGSGERAAACAVSVWYGVEYKRCRDYLLNVFFRLEKYGGRLQHRMPPPYGFDEETVDFLYDLYRNNHDFWLLHQMFTLSSDGAGAAVLSSTRVDAMRKHPRGVLRAAALSEKGLEAVRYWGFGFVRWQEGGDSPPTEFRAYVRRVAGDSKDPLRGIAERLMR
ncbi:MAG: hypothetical protein HY321_19180 [Armatimonadetes bacterium]|nr:hypothetical protein [Armatimonadota bacterium]